MENRVNRLLLKVKIPSIEVKLDLRNSLYVLRKRVKDYNYLLLYSCVWGLFAVHFYVHIRSCSGRSDSVFSYAQTAFPLCSDCFFVMFRLLFHYVQTAFSLCSDCFFVMFRMRFCYDRHLKIHSKRG